MINETEARLNTHEAVCAERYKSISESLSAGGKRMQKLEYMMYAVIAGIIFGPGAVVELIKHIFAAP